MKINSCIGLFLLIIVCFSCQKDKNQGNKSILNNCNESQYLRRDDFLFSRSYLSVKNIFLIESFEYGFYPDLDVFDSFNMPVLNSYIHPSKLAGFKFVNKEEMNGSISILVDTTKFTSIPLKDRSLTKESCFIARDIYFKNQTDEKYYLLDRYNCVKLMMEAKNEKGKWMDLHDIRAIGCGLEEMISNNAFLRVLAPDTYLKTCFLVEDGEFETECRLKYIYHNSIGSRFIRTGEDSGYFIPEFDIEELSRPIYSNTFRQKICKDRLRKARKVF